MTALAAGQSNNRLLSLENGPACVRLGSGLVSWWQAEDDAVAEKWYRKAAEQGLAEAQNNLGLMCVLGRGVSQDDAEAVKWFRKAAEQGYAPAQNNLGEMRRQGRGVTK